MISNTELSNKENSEHCSLFFIRSLMLVAITQLMACQPTVTQVARTFSGPVMGTDYRVTIVAGSDQDLSHFEEAIAAELERIDQSMSTYRTDSEVSDINRAEKNQLIKISASLRLVLTEAIEISKLSAGAFDITLAPIVDLWGFGPQASTQGRPDRAQIEALSESIGYDKLLLSEAGLRKANSNTNIDLSAIAKGFAVDRIAALLSDNGQHNYLVDVGGELRANGRNLEGQTWRIGIEKPQETGGVQEIVSLTNQAIATSGDYRNYIMMDGKRYSHTIDASTLEPVLHKLALVSVISANASTADALATAMMAMGEKLAVQFAQQNHIAAYFVIRTDDDANYEIKISERFANNVQ